jgi:hypothetical protein
VAFVALHATEVRFEHLPHRELPRPAQVDQFAVLLEEDFSGAGEKRVAQQHVRDAEHLSGVLQGRPDGADRNAVLGAERAQDVGLDQVQEGEPPRLVARRGQERLERTRAALLARVRTSREPRAQRRCGHAQVARGIADRVRRQLAGIAPLVQRRSAHRLVGRVRRTKRAVLCAQPARRGSPRPIRSCR